MSAGTMNSSGRSHRARSRAARNILVAATLLAVSAAADAAAQKNQAPQNQGPPNALQGFSQNRDQPVSIQSDTLVVRDKDKMATFTGNVHVIQGDTDMRSKTLVVYYLDESKPTAAPAPALKAAAPTAGEGQQKIRKIEAAGGVVVTQKDQNATGETGVLDMQANTVTLSGNVVMTHGKDVLRGQRLIVDLTTGVSRIDGRVDVLIGTTPGSGANVPLGLPQPPTH
jgi:lipopolysaccharide export system protein LptA